MPFGQYPFSGAQVAAGEIFGEMSKIIHIDHTINCKDDV
jgi:hypothetical protein